MSATISYLIKKVLIFKSLFKKKKFNIVVSNNNLRFLIKKNFFKLIN